MRHLVAFIGGLTLVGGLFVLLALLVAPPEDTPTMEMSSVSMAMAEAPNQPSASDASRPAPSAPAPSPPPPAPAPSPQVQSAIELPEPELPAMPQASVPTEMTLPDLKEQAPEPAPTPAPTPEPPPEHEPEPAPEPAEATMPADDSTATVAEAEGASASEGGASNAQAQSPGPQTIGPAPQPTRQVAPVYPSRAQRRGLEGHVVMAFTIRPDGSVDRDSIKVIEADPARVFDRAATRAIADWQFPATGSSRRVSQPLQFELK
ncbi:MAG: iron transporter [Halomonadaceae bacterium]|nr:iron transporter [Halomonadaceae bacterium]